MSQYLRDEFLKNLNLEEENIKEINQELLGIRDKENTGLNDDNIKFIKLSYIIRFDKKGFLLHDFKEVLECFHSAKKVERLIFVLKSNEYEKTFTKQGKGVEIYFDALDPNNCKIIVQDDYKAWTDSTFLILKEKIDKFANLNYLVRNSFITFAIQILGVISGLLLSLWVALSFSSKLSIRYSYGFTFIVAFLLFSNVWTYLYLLCLKMVNFFWPNILFKKRSGIYNTVKSLISTLFVSYYLIAIGWIGTKLWHFFVSIFITKKV